jgi:hypothetical protein
MLKVSPIKVKCRLAFVRHGRTLATLVMRDTGPSVLWAIAISVVLWISLLAFLGIAARKDSDLWILFGFMVVFGLPICMRCVGREFVNWSYWRERRARRKRVK